jgi:hypothetical protein
LKYYKSVNKFIEKEYDSDEYDKTMSKMFDDKYFDKEDSREESIDGKFNKFQSMLNKWMKKKFKI